MDSLIEIMSPLGENLLIRQISGEESLGRLFEFRLDLLSPKSEVDPDDLLGQLVTIKLEQSDESVRHFNGHVTRIEQTGHDGRYFTSQAVLRPWLWFLTRKTDCRIHQDLTVPEILKRVFDEYPDIAVVDFRLSGDYRKWEYCVQYRESDFNFVSRLMEHEGIYYFFDHGSGGHKLVLVDAYSAHKEVKGFEKLAYYAESPRGRAGVEYVQQWRHAQDFRSGQYATRDYDFKQPQKSVQATKTNSAPPALSEAEVFDYPGGYIENPHGEQYAEVRLAELQTGYESANGSSNSRSLYVGSLFWLNNHPTPKRNAQYLVTRMSMHATHPAHEASNAGDGARFGCSFSVIPAKQQFRPRRSTQKPVMQGPQTAVVVGADGDEIYVDSFGRVKVKFHWDRHEPKDNKEENRSCWIRVSQAMAGKNWGFVSIPRVKQEVIVDFIEGDPDQPIITGRVYNGDQMPPYDLPGNATQTGLKTRSSKGGSPANYNELRFEDKKGAEMITVHAERDMSSTVERDDSTSVGNDQSLTVGHDQRTNVKNHQTLSVDHDRTLTVGDNEVHSVGKSQTHTIGLDQFNYIGTDRVTRVGASQHSLVGMKMEDPVEAVPGAVRIDLTKGGEFTSVTDNQDVRVGGKQTVTVTGELHYKAKRMVFEAEHIEHNISGANSVIHDAPNGPYKIIANAFNLTSNTDIKMSAVGEILQVCNKHTLTKMGPADDTSSSIANSVKLGASNDIFVGMKSAASLSIDSTFGAGISSSIYAGIKMDMSAGMSIATAALRTYGVGASAPATTIGKFAAWADKISKIPNLLSKVEAIQGAMAIGGMLWAGGSVLAEQEKTKADKAKEKADAKKALLDLAQEALEAGHPNVAARTLAMAMGVDLGPLLAGSTDSLDAGGAVTEQVLDTAIRTAKGESLKDVLNEKAKENLQSQIDQQREENALNQEFLDKFPQQKAADAAPDAAAPPADAPAADAPAADAPPADSPAAQNPDDAAPPKPEPSGEGE